MDEHIKYKNLKLACDYEKEYPNPEIYLNEDGTKKYAFVTLVMLGDLYVSAAIVMAYSLRRENTMADLVVLVTNDVSEEAKDILGKFFDKVIDVEYLKVFNWRTSVQKHRQYLNYVFTKFKCLLLTEYDKIVLIDADAIMLKKPDHLFTLQSPAGVFLENKNLFITYNKKGEYIVPKDNEIEWYKKMCECCGHGKIIPQEYTDRIKKQKKNSGVAGGLMILKPDKKEYENIMKDLETKETSNLIANYYIWPEQQYLTVRYSGKWTSINPVYLGLQGYPHWRYLFGVQYAGDKPFVLKSKFPVEERIKYDDFKLWHYYFKDILNENRELRKSKVLYQAIKLNEYFRDEDFSLYRMDKTDIVSKVYDINKKRINNKTVNYYYLNKQKSFNPHWFKKEMFNIESKDYESLLKNMVKFTKNTKSNYFKNLKVSNKLSLMEQKMEEIDRDNLATLYTMCRNSSFSIFLWERAVPYIEDLIKFLDGDVYYYKKYNVNKKTLRNILYFIYSDFSIDERNKFIDNKLEYIKLENDETREFYLILFDNINNKKIDGQGAPYKKEIRKYILNKIKNNSELRGNDLIHISDYFYQTVEISQMLLNNNSLNLLKEQDLDNQNRLRKSFLMLNTFRKYYYTKLRLQDLYRSVCIGGSILWCHGVRETSDIDTIIINTKDSEEIDKNIYENLINKSSKIKFLDVGIQDNYGWRDSWTEKNNVAINTLNINSYDNVCVEPDKHFYFMGIKFHSQVLESAKKFVRFHYKDLSDLLYLGVNNKSFNIVYNEENKMQVPSYSPKPDNKTLEDSIEYLRKTYNIDLKDKETLLSKLNFN